MKLLLSLMLILPLGACVDAPIVSSGSSKAGGDTVVICHRKKTMELPREAAKAHLNHGDRFGPC